MGLLRIAFGLDSGADKQNKKYHQHIPPNVQGPKADIFVCMQYAIKNNYF